MSHFDQFSFAKSVTDALFKGDPEAASNIVSRALEAGDLAPDHYRVINAQRLIASHNEQVQRFEECTRDNPDTQFEVIRAQPRAWKSLGGIPARLTPATPEGRYETTSPSNPLTGSIDLSKFSQDEAPFFTRAGYEKATSPTTRDVLHVERNCRLSALGGNDGTLLTGDGLFHPPRSGRVAKFSSSVLVQIAKRSLKEALVLPFPHSQWNYYHAFAEMTYGLRHVHMIGDAVPIVYDEDRFSLLPVMADMLGIDMARFVKASTLRDHIIETAYLPDAAHFYWDASFVSLYRSAAVRRFSGSYPAKPIYVSRQKSSRAGSYESDLAEALEARGFDIIHAQDLSVTDQIGRFTNATCIISPHGAGMTNAVFARSGTPVIEIFEPSMVSPDFYQRMKFVTENYHPLVNLDGETTRRVLQVLDAT